MEIEEIYKNLTNDIKKEQILKNEPMSKYTTFKIGGNADILVKAKSIEDIANTIKFSRKHDIPTCIIGNGSNILVKDSGIRGIVVKNEIQYLTIEKQNDKAIITVDSGTKLSIIAQKLLKEQITGFEFAARNSWNNWWSN